MALLDRASRAPYSRQSVSREIGPRLDRNRDGPCPESGSTETTRTNLQPVCAADCTLGWMDPSRTADIERIAALFCSMPLTADNVFLRPARLDGSHGEREVCDVLVALRGHGIVLSLKSQDAATSREGPKLHRWCAKHARKAAGQISGASRAMKMQSFSCQHWRRGRIDFAAGVVTPVHALAIIETGPLPTDTARLPDDLPDSAGGTPITYITLNDGLNLVDQLRSIPDLIAYLDERATLPMWCRRMIGNERCLLQYYMLNGDSFADCPEPKDFFTYVLVTERDFLRLIEGKREADAGARFIEHIAEALATRNEDYAEGLGAETLALFEPVGERSRYLMIQEHLADLWLADRRKLGTAFLDVIEQADASHTSRRRSWWSDRKPGFLYMIAAGVERAHALRSGPLALEAALAHYGKQQGMLIVRRDGGGFDICLAELPPQPSPALLEAGRRMFGHLRVFTTETDSLLPRL